MPGLHVIAAGSLLEFEMEKMSFPVGRVEFMYMYPLTFEEFLINLDQERLNAKRPALFDEKPVEDVVHNLLMDRLKEIFEENNWKALEKKNVIQILELEENIDKEFIKNFIKEAINEGTLYEPKPKYIKFTRTPD